MRHDDWIYEDEYPSDKDLDAFGDDSPPDDDPLTIGYVGDSRSSFLTARQVIILLVVIVMVSALLLPFLVRLFA